MLKKNLLLIVLILSTLLVTGQNIPIDFETPGNGADWVWTVFENVDNPVLEIIENPDPAGVNPSATVAKFTALQAGAPFAGCETLHGAGIGTFTINESNQIINIMVWKSTISDVGIKLVRSDNWSLGEIKIANTKINEWEQLTFDFSSHLGLEYDQLVVFPDFNARTMDQIIYFDNIFGATVTATSVANLATIKTNIYPNPAQEQFTIEANDNIDKVEIYKPTGELVLMEQKVGKSLTLDIFSFSNGMFIVKTTVLGQTKVDKLIKVF